MLPIDLYYSPPPSPATTGSTNDDRSLMEAWRAWAAMSDKAAAERRDQAVLILADYLRSSRQTLNLSQLGLTILPTQWPASLTKLNISFNQLRWLPTLPGSLIKLDASFNQLSHLPATLPVSLQVLKLNDNLLTSLPALLPASLRRLDVSFNLLSQLPQPLPADLYLLYAAGNQLTELVTPLPPSLLVLNVSRNQLKALPQPLPALLTVLRIDDNPITTLSGQLPQSLTEVKAEPLLQADLVRLLPHLHNNTFIEEIAVWTSNVTPWRSMRYQPDAQLFGSFLEKLNSKNIALKQRVGQLLDYLANDQHRAIRTRLFLIAAEAYADCIDRVSFYFNQMYVAMLEDQLTSHDTAVCDLFQTNLKLFRLQLLEKIAAEKVAERRGIYPNFGDDIEIYLAYQCRLRRALALPIYTDIYLPDIAKITRDDIKKAYTRVLEQEKCHFIRYLVTESSSWWTRLKQWNDKQVQVSNESYLATIDSDFFKQSVNRILINKTIDQDDIDARRTVEKQLADDLLYAQRSQLSRLFLAHHQALHLLNHFDDPNANSLIPVLKANNNQLTVLPQLNAAASSEGKSPIIG